MLKTSIGFEISGNDLRIAIVKSVFGKLRVAGVDMLQGFVGMDDAQRRESLNSVFRKQRIGAGHYTLTIPQDCGIIRQLEFPLEIRDKLSSAIALQVETLSPWNNDEIYWSYSAESPKDAKNVTANVAIIPRVAIDPWISFFKMAGFPLSSASLSSSTSAHGVVTIWQNSQPTIVLSCADEAVDGVILNGNRVGSLTLKGADIAASAKTVVERLLALSRVQPSVEVRLIVQGPKAGELQQEPVKIPLEGAGVDAWRMFGALSTALTALKPSAFNLNLIPVGLRFRRNQLRLIPTYALLLLLVVLGLLMLFREPYQAMVYASKLDAEIQSITPAVRELSAQEAELNRLSEKYRALTNHFAARDRNLDAIRELSRVLPASAWLTSYVYQEDGVAISGFAPGAAEVQKAIEDSPLFKEAQFTNSVTRDPSGKDRFALKMKVEAAK